MKLYIWTNVLCDYTCGMIVALAPDLEVAQAAMDTSHVRAEMTVDNLQVIDLSEDVKPQAWYVYGGG